MTTRKTHQSQTKDLDLLEAHLAGTLKRVAPSKDIIQRLREKIHIAPRAEIAYRLHDWQTLFFVFGGVLSGMLLIITVARAFYYLVGRRGA